MGITHFDEAERAVADLGHLQSTWTYLGYSADLEDIGCSRIQVADGGWATPAHEHGGEEEIFYVLGGRGLSWQDGVATPIAAGDCIVYLAEGGAHTLNGIDGLDVLAFGENLTPVSVQFPRIGLTRVASRLSESIPGSIDEYPTQWLRESELGPPELGAAPEERPPNIVNLADVEPLRIERTRVARTRRHISKLAGSKRTGLQHVEVDPGKESTAQHCHSIEHEIFVVLAGDGVLVLGDEEIPMRTGSVVARPASTGVGHMFRAGAQGMTYLAYGTRDAGDICYYPRSNKIAFRGVHVIARLEQLEYWDGEE